MKFLFVTAVVLAVIVHGSLFPYAFRSPPGSASAVAALLQTWATPPTGYVDLFANILLYIPFGLFAVLALRFRHALLPVALLGLTLSCAVELLQFYDAGRVTNMSDVYLNTLGTLLGGLAAAAMRRRAFQPSRHWLSRPAPCLLLAAFLGYRLFPYVPTIDLHKYWNSVKPVFLNPGVGPYLTFRYFALWLAVSFLLSDAMGGARRGRVWLPLFALSFFAAKILIVGQFLTASEMAGALGAIGMWLLLAARYPQAAKLLAAAALTLLVIAQGLEPFAFQAEPKTFQWVPFRSFLQGSLAVNIQSLFEKAFLYGSLVWLWSRTSAAPLRWTVPVASVLLLAISTLQTWLPGRSAEITDACIVLIMGAILAALTGDSHAADLEPARPRSAATAQAGA